MIYKIQTSIDLLEFFFKKCYRLENIKNKGDWEPFSFCIDYKNRYNVGSFFLFACCY